MVNFEKYIGKVVYFIGIGGVSMSALAKLSLRFGLEVMGSDINSSETVADLESYGIVVYTNQTKDNITPYIDLCVYTQAVSLNNEELVQAKALGIECMSRGEYLSLIATMFQDTIAVSGTHGKTTTTALISHILSLSGANPTLHLGGVSNNAVSSAGNALSQVFVTEACEYKDSFKNIHSKIAVVTNIEKEHMDYYSNMDSVVESYSHFVGNSSISVVWLDAYTKKLKSKYIYTCGFSDSCDFCVKNIKQLKVGFVFDIYYGGVFLYRFESRLIGMHNVCNAVLGIATAYLYGVDLPYIYMGVLTFRGVKRRYEYIGDYMHTPVILDYAHHPTEIRSSIEGIKSLYKRVLCIFQPHTYSRTKTLMQEFRSCFKGVKHLAIFKTYPAREKYTIGGRAIDLYNKVYLSNKTYLGSKKALHEYLSKLNASSFDVILVLGAGNIADIVSKYILKN